jgi:peptide/nickel transport system permease protein
MVDRPLAALRGRPGYGAPLASSAGRRVEEALQFMRRQPVIVVAMIPILVLIVAACVAPWLPIADPNRGDILKRFLPPGAEGHLLGTDSLGRDIFSRLIWGGRISIAAGIAANVGVTVAAVFFGLLAGSLGGKIDAIIMRLVDIGLAFPGLLLALVILSILGQGVLNLVVAIALASIPLNVRFFRGEVLRVRHGKFVEAARMLGYGQARIMFGEILPNVMPLILTVTATHATGFFIVTAGFSLLGLGIQPPTADWGSMIGEGIANIYQAPTSLLGPTLIVTVLALSFNVIGDEVQRILSPKEGRF